MKHLLVALFLLVGMATKAQDKETCRVALVQAILVCCHQKGTSWANARPIKRMCRLSV